MQLMEKGEREDNAGLFTLANKNVGTFIQLPTIMLGMFASFSILIAPIMAVVINKIDIIRRTRQNEMVRDYARRGLDNFGKELDGPRDVKIHGPISLTSRTDWLVWQRKRPPVPYKVMKKCLLFGVRAVELGMTEEEKTRQAEFEAFKKLVFVFYLHDLFCYIFVTYLTTNF